MKQIQDIDTYISGFPEFTQKQLQKIRAAIRKAAPKATESINYGVPTFSLEGNLVHFGGYKHHIGFYPGADGIAAFKKELSVYKGAKGSVQFPLDEPLPLALVTKIVKFRIEQNLFKAEEKLKKKSMRVCPNGHTYYKSSDCPTCPICGKNKKPQEGFLSELSAPARRALETHSITTLKKLSTFRETDILAFHGMGPASMPKLRKALKAAGLSFKK